MKFSGYQEAIFDWVRNGRGSCVVEAVAGSGKTSTIVQAAQFIPPGTRALFLAFNKAIAEELKARLPAHVEARTMNSLGNGIVFRNAGKRPLDVDKLDRVIREVVEANDGGAGLLGTFKYPLRVVVRRVRNLGVRPEELVGDLWEDVKEEVVYECDDLDASFLSSWHFGGRGFFDVLRDWSRKVVKGTVDAKDIDFDDQIYLPIYHGWTVRPFDFVFVDECQDLSPANRKLLRLASDERTRFCFVGDARQAIYAFRGADSRSIQRIKEDFGAESLPLSICYRCPKDVVRMAKGIASEIEWFDGNDDGKVATEPVPFDAGMFEATDLIVSRLNAPIVGAAIQLAKAGKRCVVLGRDFGKSLSSLVRSFKCRDVEDVPAAARRWMDRKVEALLKVGKDEDSAAVAAVVDKYDALMYFYVELRPADISEYCSMIESRFSDSEDGHSVVLSTIHKAKGGEYDRVFILDAGRIGAFKGRGGDQEDNIMYVAVTRAKRELGFVNIGDGKRSSDLFRNMLADYRASKEAATDPAARAPLGAEPLELAGAA